MSVCIRIANAPIGQAYHGLDAGTACLVRFCSGDGHTDGVDRVWSIRDHLRRAGPRFLRARIRDWLARASLGTGYPLCGHITQHASISYLIQGQVVRRLHIHHVPDGGTRQPRLDARQQASQRARDVCLCGATHDDHCDVWDMQAQLDQDVRRARLSDQCPSGVVNQGLFRIIAGVIFFRFPFMAWGQQQKPVVVAAV